VFPSGLSLKTEKLDRNRFNFACLHLGQIGSLLVFIDFE